LGGKLNTDTVTCDRCGLILEKTPKFLGMTIGYYENNIAWSEFFNPGEKILCDECLQGDLRYLEIYNYSEYYAKTEDKYVKKIPENIKKN